MQRATFDPTMIDPTSPPIGGAVLVRFERRARKHEFKSREEGREIFEDCDFIIKVICGTNDIIERPAEKKDIEQYPQQYANFLRLIGDGVAVQEGFPLAEVSWMTESRKQELRAMNVFTLEQLSALPDSVISRCGLGTRDEVGRASAQLKQIQDASHVNKVASESSELRRLIEEIREENKELRAELIARKEASGEASAKQRGPGRPRKEGENHESL